MTKKAISYAVLLFIVMLFFAIDVQAARVNGEVIFAKDLAVGEVVTVKIASNTYKDAVVVEKGETPRLVLTENLGSDAVYKATDYIGPNRDYEISDLKNTIDSRTLGHGDYLFNISAPFAQEVTKSFVVSDHARVFDPRLSGAYWTRSPYYNDSDNVMAINDCICTYSHANSTKGVRPAFNLKSDTILKYNNGKYTVTTLSVERAGVFFKRYGFDAIISIPQGQTPTGFSVLPGYTGVFYKEFNGMYFFACTQDYTPPTNIGSLNIDFSSEMSQATFTRSSNKFDSNGTLVSAGFPSYETGKFNNGVHIDEATSTLLSNGFFVNDSNADGLCDNWDKVYGLSGAVWTHINTTGWANKAQKCQISGAYGGAQLGVSQIINVTAGNPISVRVTGKTNKTIVRIILRDFTHSIDFKDISFNVTVGAVFDVSASSTIPTDCTSVRIYVAADKGTDWNVGDYIEFYAVNAETKNYSTSFTESARVADSLYYTLPQPLPDEWAMRGTWIPDQDSTIERTNKLYIIRPTYDGNNYFVLYYNVDDDKIEVLKRYAGIGVEIESSAVTFSAGDIIDWVVMQLTQAHGDLAAGMHLWFKIGTGEVVHISNTDVNLPIAPTKVYIACHPSGAGFEANGVIDAVKLIDISTLADQGTTINNAWAESFLTAPNAPVSDEATLLLCNFDNNLN